MSPIGRCLLKLCGNDLSISLYDVDQIAAHQSTNRQAVKTAAVFLGIRILGGSLPIH